jgi:hypothetical protein
MWRGRPRPRAGIETGLFGCKIEAHMSWFRQEPEVEIIVASGTVRVTIHPSPHWFFLMFQAAVMIAFARILFRNWSAMPLVHRILVSLAHDMSGLIST